MLICDGDVSEYNELNKSSIDTYLFKLENYIDDLIEKKRIAESLSRKK